MAELTTMRKRVTQRAQTLGHDLCWVQTGKRPQIGFAVCCRCFDPVKVDCKTNIVSGPAFTRECKERIDG